MSQRNVYAPTLVRARVAGVPDQLQALAVGAVVRKGTSRFQKELLVLKKNKNNDNDIYLSLTQAGYPVILVRIAHRQYPGIAPNTTQRLSLKNLGYVNLVIKMDLTVLSRAIFLAVLLGHSVHSKWWYLGLDDSLYQSTMTSTLSLPQKCSQIDVLTRHQMEICSKSRDIIGLVKWGASIAIDECQWQFKHRRWNCTTFNNTDVFGGVTKIRSRENAFVHAITSAGLTFAKQKACDAGDFKFCQCEDDKKNEVIDNVQFEGCPSKIRSASRFTQKFLGGSDRRGAETLMNRWNNRAGWEALKKTTKVTCRCHGKSCALKTCWQKLPMFREVGFALRKRHDEAIKVRYDKKRNELSPQVQQTLKHEDLVYFDHSPDFCQTNAKYGFVGTSGRLCNATSRGMDSCELMCCGRGYNTRYVEDKCNCTFIWCCAIKCQQCLVPKQFCK